MSIITFFKSPDCLRFFSLLFPYFWTNNSYIFLKTKLSTNSCSSSLTKQGTSLLKKLCPWQTFLPLAGETEKMTCNRDFCNALVFLNFLSYSHFPNISQKLVIAIKMKIYKNSHNIHIWMPVPTIMQPQQISI